MGRRRVRVVSQAHEWVHAQGLCEDDGTFDNALLQQNGSYIPDLASDDPFSGAEITEFYVESTEDSEAAGVPLGRCDGIQFPDGSGVWWSDFWSFTDPHGYDITQQWQLSEVTRTRRK
jgi:hypothetical protein